MVETARAGQKTAAGVLLAGGRGKRLGRDKALLVIGEGLALGRLVLDAMAPCVSELIVSVDRPERANLPERLGAAGVRVVVDEEPGLGPLGGLASSLSATAAGVLFVAACDYPLLVPGAVRQLLDALGERDAALPEIAGRLHPLCGAYSRGVLPRLRAYLAAGERRAVELALSLDLARLTEADFDSKRVDVRRAFTNVNTPEDLARVAGESEASSSSLHPEIRWRD